MCNPAVADLVQAAITHFDAERYRLHAWCIMPNHVHLVIQPLEGYDLAKIVHSIKSYTAHEINNRLGRSGSVWMPEYYDRLIRNPEAYGRVVEYVLDNPQMANLVGWPWLGRRVIDET